nr:hypothetical protein [Tanacetum cinerariifolium]
MLDLDPKKMEGKIWDEGGKSEAESTVQEERLLAKWSWVTTMLMLRQQQKMTTEFATLFSLAASKGIVEADGFMRAGLYDG